MYEEKFIIIRSCQFAWLYSKWQIAGRAGYY